MKEYTPIRAWSYRRPGADGEPAEIALSADLIDQGQRYAREWQALFGRPPQGQHPLKFPVNRQISAREADLILEFPVPRNLPAR